MVSPYSWDVPGGAQQQISDLVTVLSRMGHDVSVIAPCAESTALEHPYLTSAGRAVPVPYNGSVARLCFGFSSAHRVRRWLAEGSFDVVHVHEPTAPSTSLLATFFADAPLVATFHAAVTRSLALSAAAPILQTALEKVSIRIAVSESARDSLVSHLGGTAIVIPNGVDASRYAESPALPGWPPRTLSGRGRTIGFVGRLDDPRKGLTVLTEAFDRLAATDPDVRLLVVGPGDQREALRKVAPRFRDRVTFTGLVSDAVKISALHSMDVYCAPNLGGESFGIVLTEAMASGAPVVASDIDAFLSVIRHGRAGDAFRAGDGADLARVIEGLLADGDRRRRLSAAAREAVRQYDWSVVAADIVAVYDTVTRPLTGRLRTA